MLEIVIFLIMVLIGFLNYKYGRVSLEDLPDAYNSVAGYTSNMTLLSGDIDHFSQNYSKYSKEFIETRLDKSNEYTKVFNVFKDAMNKGKRFISYKDVPNSPKMYSAFSDLVHNPDHFFQQLAKQSQKVSDESASFLGNKSNVSNLGLQVVNNIRPQDRVKYTPTPPANSWKHIERSRGSHRK